MNTLEVDENEVENSLSNLLYFFSLQGVWDMDEQRVYTYLFEVAA